MERPLGLASFVHQRRLEHALTVVGAVIVFWLAYFGAVGAVYGELSVLAPATSVDQQRVGGVAGSIAVWTYFGIAFIRGYGGPVLNAVAYPLAIVLLAPFLGRWLLFGPDLAGLTARFVGVFVLEPLLTAALIVFPGLGAFVTVLAVWAAVLDDTDRRAWERRHLPEAFREAFVDEERSRDR
ncbi:hypothetical protein [Natronococcus occultus]|uniref:Uncharacterized protein n=1 Tax=Natronococcus occultus SP4 TaxID=694430 RepID=L0JWD9_9EURY|nr:hypothetical protein [Natronococcus occultus]AGB36630.1 hypothetical protein Natoc_0773 [Natronococcus occultus SP4]